MGEIQKSGAVWVLWEAAGMAENPGHLDRDMAIFEKFLEECPGTTGQDFFRMFHNVPGLIIVAAQSFPGFQKQGDIYSILD